VKDIDKYMSEYGNDETEYWKFQFPDMPIKRGQKVQDKEPIKVPAIVRPLRDLLVSYATKRRHETVNNSWDEKKVAERLFRLKDSATSLLDVLADFNCILLDNVMGFDIKMFDDSKCKTEANQMTTASGGVKKGAEKERNVKPATSQNTKPATTQTTMQIDETKKTAKIDETKKTTIADMIKATINNTLHAKIQPAILDFVRFCEGNEARVQRLADRVRELFSKDAKIPGNTPHEQWNIRHMYV
jgi:hypothetical protein